MRAKYKAVGLRFGATESNTIGQLVFVSNADFDTRKEALHSLVEYLYSKYMIEGEERNKIAPHKNRCDECKKSIVSTFKYEENDWQEFLKELLRADFDSYGVHEEAKNSYIWDPFSFDFNVRQDQMIIINENAELFLTKVLYEMHPELKTEFQSYIDTKSFNDDYHNLMDEECIYEGGEYVYK